MYWLSWYRTNHGIHRVVQRKHIRYASMSNRPRKKASKSFTSFIIPYPVWLSCDDIR